MGMEAAIGLDYRRLYEQEKAQRCALELRLSVLRQELDQIRKLIYGSRQERFVPTVSSLQLTLGLEIEPIAAPPSKTQQVTYTKTTTETSNKIAHPGRSPLPAHLRREEIILEPTSIPEGSTKIGEEITEELELIPAELYVKKYVRPKYVLAALPGAIKSEIIIAAPPCRPLPKAIAGAGLLSQIVIEKYVDHLPVYRQMQRFKRAGVDIAYSTITGWVENVCELIAPLYEALKSEVLQSGYLHADETPIKVLDDEKKGKSHRGYFWVYQNSPGRLVFFDYQEGRGVKGPQGILKEYKGYLQTDGYKVYDSFKRKEITLVSCMAHARRYFYDARNNDAIRANYALEQIQQLYAIEELCRKNGLNEEQTRIARDKASIPILNAFGLWMKEQYKQVVPKSTIAKAIGYSLQRWDKLTAYTSNGMLNIDNNPVENSIRPVALGRKNYLFCGSHEAAQRTAMLYSLLGTCKLHHVNPTTWLKEVLKVLPTWSINQIDQLLPHKWVPNQS